jgi:hypothetical protein
LAFLGIPAKPGIPTPSKVEGFAKWIVDKPNRRCSTNTYSLKLFENPMIQRGRNRRLIA